MNYSAVEVIRGRLPLLPENWRKHAPHICAGIDADYLLLDPGSDAGQPRYPVIGLRSEAYSLHFCADLSEVHCTAQDGGLGVEASLFVPLRRDDDRHHGHVAALYCDKRAFTSVDIEALQDVARRLTGFLDGR